MSVVIPRQLNYVLEDVRDEYRPFKFREVMQVMSEIPEWADNVEVRTISAFAEIKPVTDVTGDNLPMPSVSRTPTTFQMLEFGAAYNYFDREIAKAEATGIRLDSERARANTQKAEELLDQIAAAGDPYGIGLPGIGNNASVPTVTATTKASGGTTWVSPAGVGNATSDEVLEDAHNLCNAVESNSNEVHLADTLVLPLNQFRYMARMRVGDGSETVLDVFRRQNPDIRRVLRWNRFSVLGAGTTPRAMAFDSQSPDVARMLISKEFTADAPRRIARGWQVEQTMITGGVMVKQPNGIAYQDAI